MFLRAFYKDPKDLDPPVKLIEQAKIYPLNNKAGAKAMVFPDASGVPANMLPRSDGSAFDELKALVDSESSSLASPDWFGMPATLGIVKGQPFNPDAATRAMLDRTATEATSVGWFEPLVLPFPGEQCTASTISTMQSAHSSLTTRWPSWLTLAYNQI